MNLKNEKRLHDAIDATLVELLDGNARMSITDLAKAVGMSAPSVNERIKRLEENGVILGYRVAVDPVVIGYPLMAILRIRQHPGKARQLEALMASIPEFVECDKVTGEDCYIARLYLKDISQLDPITDEIAQFGDTNTAIVKSTPIKRRLLSLR